MTLPLFITSASLELMLSEVAFLDALGATGEGGTTGTNTEVMRQVRSSTIMRKSWSSPGSSILAGLHVAKNAAKAVRSAVA